MNLKKILTCRHLTDVEQHNGFSDQLELTCRECSLELTVEILDAKILDAKIDPNDPNDPKNSVTVKSHEV